MKKLTLTLLLTALTLSVFAGKVVTKKDSLLQVSGTDSIWQIAKGTSAQFVTDKGTFRFNKPLNVNGDSLPTISRVKELIGDSMQTITGFVDLTSEQTITGIKTFNDTLIVNKVLKVDNIYTTTSKALIQATDTTLAIYNPRINSELIQVADTRNVFYKGYNSNDLISTNPTGTDYYGYGNNQGISYSTINTAYFGLDASSFINYTPTTTTISRGDTTFITMADTTIRAQKNLVAPKFYVSALNEAPASATAEGTTGEIRITTNYIYVCVSDDIWVRTELTTWP